MADFLHTMVRITDPEQSRAFYEALGFRYERDFDIVRNGETEATNYFYGIGDHDAAAGAHQHEQEGPEQLGEKPTPLQLWLVEVLQAGVLEREERPARGRGVQGHTTSRHGTSASSSRWWLAQIRW